MYFFLLSRCCCCRERKISGHGEEGKVHSFIFNFLQVGKSLLSSSLFLFRTAWLLQLFPFGGRNCPGRKRVERGRSRVPKKIKKAKERRTRARVTFVLTIERHSSPSFSDAHSYSHILSFYILHILFSGNRTQACSPSRLHGPRRRRDVEGMEDFCE